MLVGRELLTRILLSRGYLSVLTNFDCVFAGNLRFSSTQCRKKYWRHRGTREFTCVLGWLCDLITRIGRLTFNLHLVAPWHFIPVTLHHSRAHCIEFHSFGWWFIIVTVSTNTLLSSNAKKLYTHLISWNVSSYDVRFFNKLGFFFGENVERLI